MQEHVQMPETMDSNMKAHKINNNLHSFTNLLKVHKATSWHIQRFSTALNILIFRNNAMRTMHLLGDFIYRLWHRQSGDGRTVLVQTVLTDTHEYWARIQATRS